MDTTDIEIECLALILAAEIEHAILNLLNSSSVPSPTDDDGGLLILSSGETVLRNPGETEDQAMKRWRHTCELLILSNGDFALRTHGETEDQAINRMRHNRAVRDQASKHRQ